MDTIKLQPGLPKALVSACLKHQDKIEEVYSEGEDGFWIICRDGFWNSYTNTISIHEWSVRSAIHQLKHLAPDPRPSNER